MSFYALSAVRGDGTEVAMSEFEGKVVYATNVASKWGLTRREYARFEQLGQRWGDQLAILAFPTREFGGQEFLTDEEIKTFADGKNFPGILMKLGKVTGDDVPEVWKFLREQAGGKDPTWNFDSKYLVSKTGRVMATKNVDKDIEALMKE